MALTIRLATPGDAAGCLAIYAPFCHDTPVSFEVVPPSVEEMAARMARTLAQFPWFVAAEGDEVRGYVYAGRFRERAAYQWSAEVTAYVQAGRRRQGLGRALYTALFEVLAAQGYRTVLAGITLPNPASVGLHEALGFTPVGVYRRVGYKLGAWHDVGWWQRPLRAEHAGEAPPPPGSLRPVTDVVGSPAWEAALTAGCRLLV
jgi:phosphinothricin acetyltransferase